MEKGTHVCEHVTLLDFAGVLRGTPRIYLHNAYIMAGAGAGAGLVVARCQVVACVCTYMHT
jgi:hypothetical protein